MRWDISRTSLSMGAIQGQSVHVQLICHVCLVGLECYSITMISESSLRLDVQWIRRPQLHLASDVVE